MTDQQMGLQARLMSKALRKITGTCAVRACCGKSVSFLQAVEDVFVYVFVFES